MGIVSLKRKIPSRHQRKKDNSIAKCFVDRESQRSIFKEHISKISDEYSLLLFFAGAGGSGKTALIRELENSLLTKSSVYKYASYDFKEEGTDMITTLNVLKKSLVDKYGAEFPLYEKGYIYYLQKRGDMVSREHIEDVFNRSSVLQKALGHICSTIQTLDNANIVIRGGKIFVGKSLGLLDRVYDTSLLLRILKMGVVELDKIITERAQKAREKEDIVYGEIIRKLEEKNCESNADVIKEYLPILFARDISDWLREKNFKLIIFLDTYEILTGDEKDSIRHEKLVSLNYDVPVDWWIEELLTRTSRILWVIAGRSEISKIGEEIEIIRNDTLFPLTALDNEFSDKFLLDSGITNPKLRQGIIDLTKGYPNYLSVCVDTYNEIVTAGGEPAIEDFGGKREIIVNRLINFMNESARNMVKRLCVLGTWTDDIAQCILSVLHENNIYTYNRVKKLSFIFSQSIGSNSKKIIRFDRNIQEILFDYLKETDRYFIEETRKAANYFFCNIFYNKDDEENSILDDIDLKQFFKFWCEIIARTSIDAEDLVIQYDRYLMPLNDIFDDNFIESVVKEFQNDVRIKKNSKTIFYAYFEHLLAKIKLRQFIDKDAIKYAESAYSKFENAYLTPKQSVIKISVENTLADVYKRLKRTANEIALRKKVLAESEKVFPDKADDRIISAKKNLANALERGDKKNRARILRKEILITLKSFNDERTIQAASDYAYALEYSNKHKYSLSIREKIIDFYRNTNNIGKLISEIKKLILVLNKFSSNEYLEKKLSLQREIVSLYKKKDGEYSSSVVWAMNDVFNTLKNLNNKKNAIQECENLAEKFIIRIKNTENLEEKVKLIENLIIILKNTSKADEATKWQDKVKKNLREIVAMKLREPVKNYEVTISFIDNLINELDLYADYHEVIALQREILRLTKKNPNTTVDEIIPVMKYFAYMLSANPKGYDEALALRNQVVDILKQKYSYDKINKKVLSAMDDVAVLLEKIIGEPYLALAERQEILRLLKENNAPAKQILSAMEKITELYTCHLDNYIESLNWRKRILEYCRQNFSEDSSEVIIAMENLASTYESFDEYSMAAKLRDSILAIKSEKRGGQSNLDVINTQKIIADQFHEIGKYEDELEIRKKIVTLYRKNYEENSGRRYEIVNALNEVADLLRYLSREQEAQVTQKIIVNELKKDYADIAEEFGEYSDDAIMKMDDIADALHKIGNYNDELTYRKKIFELRNSIDKNSVETIYALEKLASFFEITDNEEEEFKIRSKIVNICQEALKVCVTELADDKTKISAMYRILIANKDLGNEENVAQMEEAILNARYCIAEKRRKVFGKNHPRTVEALEELAEDLHAYGYNFEELVIRRDILERLKENSNYEFNEEILKEMKHIAHDLDSIGDFEGSLKLWQEILNFCRSQREGDTNERTLKVMNNIAMVFEHLNNPRAVLEIRQDILKIYKQKYANEDCNDSVIHAMYDKARALENLEDYDSALLMLRQIIELYTKKYGENGYKHDNTINAIEHVAILLEKIGDLENAIIERKKIINLLKRKYPTGHEKIIVAMKKIACLFEKNNDYVQALEWRENILYVDSDFVDSSYTLSNTFEHLRLPLKAKNLRESIVNRLKILLDEYIDIYGQKSDKVIETLEKLSFATKVAGMYKDGINYEKLLIKILLDFKGLTAKKTLAAMTKLADDCAYESESVTLIYRENVAEIQQKILNFRIKHLGNEHSLTIDMREKLSLTFEQLNCENEADELKEENLKAYETIVNRRIDMFTELHEITLNAMGNFATNLEKNGYYDDAEKVRRRVCEIYEMKFGNDLTNSKTIDSLEKLATLLEKTKQFDEAVIIRNKIARILQEKYRQHEFCGFIIDAMKNLVKLHEMRKDFSASTDIQTNIVKLLEKRYAGYENHSVLTEAKKHLSTLRKMNI